jgi:hypothetical protein
MDKNFLRGNYYIGPPPGPPPFRPLPYFLYGDLLDPAVLMGVLGLDKPPALRLGITIGHHFEKWRGNTALVHGPVGNVVYGAVFDGPDSEEIQRRLTVYMTDFFLLSTVFVRFDQTFVADGRCFATDASIVAKAFKLRKDDILYDADGVPRVRKHPWSNE